MKTPINSAMLSALLAVGFAPGVAAQGTAFTYQGSLQTTNGAANGLYDFTFTLFPVETGGSSLTASVANGVPVSNGLFTATVDFLSANWFNGNERWLEITVRTNGGFEAPVLLSPRQQVTPSPYAIYAGKAGVASGVAPGSVTATGLANGAALTELSDNDGPGSGLDADFLDGQDSTAFALSGHTHHGQLWSGPAALGLDVRTSGTLSGSAALRGRQGIGAPVIPAAAVGVWGDSTAGHGLFGASATSSGVFGYSEDGFGMEGFTQNGGVGVLARSDATNGKGLWGQAPSETGTTYGVQGSAYSPEGTGVWGQHVASSGTEPGVLGDTLSTAPNAAGVIGRVNSTLAGGYSAGVRGINAGTGPNGIGVWGSHAGSGWGVYGESQNGYGVYAFSQNSHAVYADGSISTERVVYNAPRTHYYSIPGDSFRPRRMNSSISFESLLGTGGAYFTAGTESLALAPLHLPDGAVITSLKAYFLDNSALDLNVGLRQYYLSGYVNIATLDSSGIVGNDNKSIAVSGPYSTVQNDGRFYLVNVSSTGGNWSTAGSDLRILGVTIGYTVSEAE